MGGGIAMALGVMAWLCVAGQAWTWGAILVALVYTGVDTGRCDVRCHHDRKAHWGRPLKRVPVFWLIYACCMVVSDCLLVAGNKLYPWHPETFITLADVFRVH